MCLSLLCVSYARFAVYRCCVCVLLFVMCFSVFVYLSILFVCLYACVFLLVRLLLLFLLFFSVLGSGVCFVGMFVFVA